MVHEQEADDEKHFAAIGRVVAHSTTLESRIAVFLWKLISSDQLIGQTVTAELSFRARVLDALGRYRIQNLPLLQELETLLNLALQAGEKRDRIVHSFWGGEKHPDGRTRLKITAKKGKGLKWQVEPTTPEHIATVAAELRELADRSDDLLGRLPTDITGITIQRG